MKSDNFFDKKQKKIKAKIMHECMDSVFSNIEENMGLFKDPQHIMDLIGSILIMFNRDLLIHTLVCMEITHDREKIMDSLFNEVRKQNNKGIMSQSN